MHFSKGKAIETRTIKGLTVSLLASGFGTEVIHHALKKDSKWALGPDEGWQALEVVFILKGELIWHQAGKEVRVRAGETLSMQPILQDAFFSAKVDTEFLYVTSEPVFHHYSQAVQEMMNLAVTVEEKDGYTADHCERIKDLSMMIGTEMKLNSQEMYELNLGSFLHDVGKVKIPHSILNKPAKLTDEEYSTMKLHTVYGAEMLEETGLPNLVSAAYIVKHHHERFNGSGYPYGLKGDEIPIAAAIVAFVDSYDAMTTERVYSKARPKEQVLEELQQEKGILYHPDVVDAFLSIANKK
ncbi:HD-GYP domain-containing protein (c-di-GMP phosphodiesterase class II) [Aquibacillus albus]|uniref:HD-GYP domain-containing protein (C-di-GMP phosphodiesterase class II) n=2 Tax=Aquibacillus albus TaxID=1168171 RepID=A0ABS2MXE0_9BACI|nr:HD-GYP domain-containing protein (c-di-GMP phosphodiesterase class II) [Aquibacillus albus]